MDRQHTIPIDVSMYLHLHSCILLKCFNFIPKNGTNNKPHIIYYLIIKNGNNFKIQEIIHDDKPFQTTISLYMFEILFHLCMSGIL